MSDSTSWKVRFLVLSALIVCYLFSGCERSETITIPRGTFEKLLGQGSPDTNFVSRMEFVAARLSREELQNSNYWGQMRIVLSQIDQRLQALEAKTSAGMTTSPVTVPVPGIPAPLQSAPVVPQVPPIEKEKP